MQFGEDPSISHVANRFMGTGLLRAPLPGKLNLPLLSAMVRAAGGTVRNRAEDLYTADRCGFSVSVRVCVRACVSVKKSRHSLTLVRCERRRTNSFLRPRRAGFVGVVLCAREEPQWGQRGSERTDRWACCAYHAAPGVWRVISATQLREGERWEDLFTKMEKMVLICHCTFALLCYYMNSINKECMDI